METCKTCKNGSVTGLKGALKETQEYTKEFGKAVFDAWTDAFTPAAQLFDSEDDDDSDWEALESKATKVFDDAALEPVARKLNVPMHALICR